ncbi:hypothetical protein [Citrobacter youngae]|nr:hypothetical protein [Citrobacter youngae]
MTFSDETIMACQITAAIFMGWDYFMPKSHRKLLNRKLREYFSGVQCNVDKDIGKTVEYIIVGIRPILLSLLMVVVGIVIMRLSIKLSDLSPWLFLISNLTSLTIFCVGFNYLLGVFVKIITPLGLGGIFRLTTTFLLNTEKGPVAGVGFLALVISFIMRYCNIN